MNKSRRNNGRHPTLDLSLISNLGLPKNVKEMTHDLPSVHATDPGLTPPFYSKDWEFGLIDYRAYSSKKTRRTPPGDRTPKASHFLTLQKTPLTAIFKPLKTAIFAPKNLTLQATTKTVIALKSAHQTFTITTPLKIKTTNLKIKTNLTRKTRLIKKTVQRAMHPNDMISPVDNMPVTPALDFLMPRT